MLRLSASDALCTRLEALVTPSNGVFFALVLAVGESAVVFRALNPRDRVTPCDSGPVDNCVYVEKLWTEVKAGGCPQSASRRAAALEPHPDTEFEGGRCVCPRYIAGRRFEPARLFGGAELFAFSAEGQTPRTVSGTTNQPHGRIPFRSRHVVHPES